MTQFVANSFGEFGVQGQYLDGELHFVDDTLAVGLFFRPEFEIAQRVVSAIAVFVMHSFMAFQRAAHMFSHRFTMDESFSAASQMQAHVAARMYVPIGIDRAPRTTFPTALFAAKFLSFIVARMLPIKGPHQATFFRRATQLALKSWGRFLVHTEQLLDSPGVVKGVV
jgi:hypothetical protein